MLFEFIFITVNVLKLRTLVACKKKPRQTGETQKKLSDQGLSCLLFRQAFCDFQPWKSTFYMRTEIKKFYLILEHLPYLLSGFMLLSSWAWVIFCAPDFFSWNFAFMVINVIQMLFLMYHIRPIKFVEDLEDMYNAMFQPMKVSR